MMHEAVMVFHMEINTVDSDKVHSTILTAHSANQNN